MTAKKNVLKKRMPEPGELEQANVDKPAVLSAGNLVQVSSNSLPPSRFQNSIVKQLPVWHKLTALIERGLTPMENWAYKLTDDEIARMPSKNPVALLVTNLRRFAKARNAGVDIQSRTDWDDKKVIVLTGRSGRIA